MKFKRFLTVLVVFAFILSMLPTSVLAMVGPVTFPERWEVTYSYGDTSKTYAGHENSSPTGTYYMLFNDYITFILRPNGMMSTVPTRTLDSLFKQYMYTNIWPDFAYRVPVTEVPSFYADTGASIDLKNKALGAPTISQAGVNKLQAVYTITSTDQPVTFKVTYEIVRVDVGKTDGDYGSGLIAPDPNDPGRTWAVKASATVEYAGTKLYATDDGGGDGYGQAIFTMITEYVDFAKNRKSGDQGAIQFSTYGEDGHQFSNFWNSSVQMPRTSTGAADGEISEFFTSSFSADNQFVATSRGYGGGWSGNGTQLSGPLGHATSSTTGANYGEIITYKPEEKYLDFGGENISYRKTLKVYSSTTMYKDQESSVAEHTADALWGYRDLYTNSDDETPSDVTYYKEVKSGGHLGIVKNGDGTTLAVAGKSINDLKNAHGDKLIAVLRGNWEREGTDYKFSGNVALSPSVTATVRNYQSSFIVAEDGTVTMNNMGLSCPSFQFYTQKGTNGITFDYANSSAGVLNLVIDPSKNSSVLHLDIPGATSLMEGAKIGIDGSLVFSGTMGIYTPVLEIVNLQLDRVGMGYDGKGNYKVNGIEASGRVGMPDVIGLPIPSNSASAEINTFNGEERYHFEVEIEIPNLFESEASLTLSRLDNGALVPDDLELMIGAGVGVPLVPPVVVAEISGIGGGFSDLADSIDGDFYAVPPAKISLSAKAEVLQMLSGKATMTMGLGYYETLLSDPVFFDLIGFDAEYKENVYFTVEERKWDEKVSAADLEKYEMLSLTYTGIAVGGSRTLEIHLPSESLDILNISSGLKLDVFAGTAKGINDGYSPLYVHFNAQGSGGMKASLKFPKKIGSLKVPRIGGKTLASTEVWLSLGYKSVFAFRGDDLLTTIWDSMKNASLSATITYKKNILDLADVWFNVVFANKKQFGLGINTFIGNLNTTINLGGGNARLMGVGETEDSYYAIYANTGIESLASTDGVSLMSIEMDDDMAAKLAAAGITLAPTMGTENAENSYDITLADNAKPGQIMLMLTPKSGEYTDVQLENMFTVTNANGDEHAFIFNEYDENGDSTVANANAYISASGEDMDYETGETVNIPASVVMMLPSKGNWTISAQDAFDIEVFGFELSEDINDSGVIENLKEDKEYVLQGFLVDENGKYYQVGSASEGAVSSDDVNDYVSDFKVENGDSIYDFEFTTEYDSAPSGAYKKVYRLLEKLETDTEPKSVYYRTLDEYDDGELTITNPNEIPAPTNVTAEAMGSEILRASWEAPTNMPEGKEIDGYMVTIYEKSGDEWITTGTGYEVRKDAAGNMPTTIDMALTIGGSGVVDGEIDENALLEADKYYRISVATLSDTTADIDGDDKVETVSRRSIEAYSSDAGVFIKEATPPTLTYLPEPEVLEGANIKTLYVTEGDEIVITSSEQAEIAAIRMDDGTELSSIANAAELTVTVPEFDGNLIIQIDAMDAEGDRARDYISLKKDTVAPVITFDAESFIADDDGNFTVTGITEATAEIIVDNGRGYIEYDYNYTEEEGLVREDNYTITQEADGSFNITGKLSDITKGDSSNVGGALIYMKAKDKAGNESGWVFANVMYEVDTVETPVISPNGGIFTGTKSVTISTTTEGASIYYTTDGTEPTSESTLYEGTFTISSDTTVKAIAIKDGMEDSDVVTAEFDKQGGGETIRYTVSENEGKIVYNITVDSPDVAKLTAVVAQYNEDGSLAVADSENLTVEDTRKFTISCDKVGAYYEIFFLESMTSLKPLQ